MNHFYEREAILNCGLLPEVSQARRKANFEADRSELDALMARYGYEVVQVALSMLSGCWKKRQRIKTKTEKIVTAGECVFLTLTFNDETLANTTEETRRTYVRKFLKSNCPVYVANIDYGKKNEREHYHALVNGKVDYAAWHKYGAIRGEVVRTSKGDVERTARYVAKLTLHAIKKTAGKGRRIIYSRNVAAAFQSP